MAPAARIAMWSGPRTVSTALMRAWGVEPGQLERMPFEQRARLAQRLSSGRLGRFAQLIGRFRQMAFGGRARKCGRF